MKLTFQRVMDRILELINQDRDPSLVPALLAILIITIASSIGLGILYFGATLTLTFFGALLGIAEQNGQEPGAGAAIITILTLAGGLLTAAIAVIINIASTRPIVSYVNSEEAQTGDLIKIAFKDAFSSIGMSNAIGSLLWGILTVIGFFFLIIPGLILGAAGPLIVIYSFDNRVSFFKSIGPVFNLLKGNLLVYVVSFVGVWIAITVISSFTCGLGAVFSPVLGLLFAGIIYQEITGKTPNSLTDSVDPGFDNPIDLGASGQNGSL